MKATFVEWLLTCLLFHRACFDEPLRIVSRMRRSTSLLGLRSPRRRCWTLRMICLRQFEYGTDALALPGGEVVQRQAWYEAVDALGQFLFVCFLALGLAYQGALSWSGRHPTPAIRKRNVQKGGITVWVEVYNG